MLQRLIKKLSENGITGPNVTFFDRDCANDRGLSELEFIQAIANKKKPLVLVVDTLAKVKPETAASYDSEYRNGNELIKMAHTVGERLIVVHHSRKQMKDASELLVDQVLGSTAIAALFDNVLVYKRELEHAKLTGLGRLIDDFKRDLVFDEGSFSPLDVNTAKQKKLQSELPSAPVL